MIISASIVSKVWNYAHVLKNAGVGYGATIELRAARALITYLLFHKLAPPSPRLRRAGCEMTELGFDNPIPDAFAWSVLSGKVAAASRRSFHAYPQRRDASATLFLPCLTN